MNEHIRNCKLCKKSMEYSAFYMCHDCLQELDKVSGFLKRNPFATVEEVSIGTSLSNECVQRIIEFFRHSNTIIKP
jgi:hypothetical protein